MHSRVKVGLVGCGAIAPAYMENLGGNLSSGLEVVACSDLNHELAVKLAEKYGIAKACPTEVLLADPEIDLVLNLTPAPAHLAVSTMILQAGKHLFSEKPLCLDLGDAARLLDLARSRGLSVGGAADTFLGAGLQMARRLIEDGRIGEPVACTTLVSIPMRQNRRYHQVFKGTVLDLGPYYVTALVHLFGPVRRVVGLAPVRSPTKIDAASGETFELERASTAAAVLEFESGVTSTFLASEDVHGYFPRVEVFATTGRMTLSDANAYSGPIKVETHSGSETIEPGPGDGYVSPKRGLGVAEMAAALKAGREPLANGDLMLHTLEILLAIHRASETRTCTEIASRAKQPRLLAQGEIVVVPAGPDQ
ncbi:MAG: Gfo/Idh/MocA family oxidoreductase [Opitutaceae bacterium]